MTEEEQEEIVYNLLKELEKTNVDVGSRRVVREQEIFDDLPDGVDGVSVEQAKAALKRLADSGKIHCQNGGCSTIASPTGLSIFQRA